MIPENMMHKLARHNQSLTTSNSTARQTQQTTDESAMILIGMNNQLLTINAHAARLLGVSVEQVKGKPVAVLGDALSAIANQPTIPGSSNLLHLPNGKTILASVRNVVGQNRQPMGRVVNIQEINAVIEQTVPMFQQASYQSTPTVDTLQSQINAMNDLIQMVPRFNNNRFWQNLLVEHMQRLIEEMTDQVQQLTPISPSA